jgi:YtcA family
VNATRKSLRGMFMPALLLITGCERAPSFDIVGSFFPAWLLCLVVAVLLTVVSRTLLNRYVEIVWPVLVYPSLTAIFALALWLALFR